MKTSESYEESSTMQKAEPFLATPQFALFGLGILFFGTCIFLSLAFIPPTFGKLGQFARDFQVWCLGYRPESGQWEMGYFIMFLAGPIVLGSTFVLVWKEGILQLFHSSLSKFILPLLAAFMVMATPLGGLIFLYQPQKWAGSSGVRKNLPFPAKALRTHIPPHLFTLTNQEGKKVSLKDFQGKKVVMLTAVYATCGST